MHEIDLDTPYEVTGNDVAALDAQGYVHLPGVLTPNLVAAHEPDITEALLELTTNRLPMAQRSTYDRAFLQVTDLWRHRESIRAFVFATRFARIATELLGVRGVRLYHDQGLYKEGGGGITPWHADQYYWPMTTDRMITMWAPLQDTPLEMGPLAFARGSHRLDLRRDLPIGDESEQAVQAAFDEHGLELVSEPYALGDVSFHLGWTFHRAAPNRTPIPRRVMTVIYMDVDMVIAEPVNGVQREAIARGLVPGRTAADEVKPVLYEADA